MKKRVIIINQIQFGYGIEHLQYCRYLKEDFDVTYLCWDFGWDKIEEDGINVYYLNRNGNFLRRNIQFILTITKLLKNSTYHLIMISYFKGCSIIPILSNRKQPISLDIRTGNDSAKFI